VPIVDLDICNWARVDRLVLSPGIPWRHPRPHRLVRRARKAGIGCVGDVELLVENQPGRRIVGITGTNGKSTTTVLTAELLRGAGLGLQLGCNIGLPVLDLLPKPSDDIYVLELSSYQLELTEHLACAVAVTLNLSPDHLDRHGGMVGYGQAKKRIFRNQGASDWAVVGVDDAFGETLVSELATTRQVLPVAVGRTLDRGVHVVDGRLYDAIDGPPREVADLGPIASLRGAHNWQNAATAYAAVRVLGVAPDVAAAGLVRFAGLAHRMEQAGVVRGVRYVNDSKATNAEAAARALASFDRIYWIAGGRPKEGGLDPLLPWLDRVCHAYLIGEAAEPFAEGLAGRVACSRCGDLATAFDQASEAARRDAGNDPVVLLTPACASFDQFADFEARGDAFKALVSDNAQRAGRGASARAGGVR
jgi:UDP-N-acetylmuramoylalanine--D-glutamate ligase